MHAQWRLRSVYASPQTDQSVLFGWRSSISNTECGEDWSDCEYAQAELNLHQIYRLVCRKTVFEKIQFVWLQKININISDTIIS